MLNLVIKSQLAMKAFMNKKVKAAGMLEYMLIAVISVAAFVLIKTVFPTFLSGLWTTLSGTINKNNG
jgi:Flp pilus assembly pilin Flp